MSEPMRAALAQPLGAALIAMGLILAAASLKNYVGVRPFGLPLTWIVPLVGVLDGLGVALTGWLIASGNGAVVVAVVRAVQNALR